MKISIEDAIRIADRDYPEHLARYYKSKYGIIRTMLIITIDTIALAAIILFTAIRSNQMLLGSLFCSIICGVFMGLGIWSCLRCMHKARDLLINRISDEIIPYNLGV